MEQPPSDFWSTATAVATGLLGFLAGTRRWWWKDRRNARQDRREDKENEAAIGVIETMQKQIHELMEDREKTRAHLAICEKQHRDCRDEAEVNRLAVGGLRELITELESKYAALEKKFYE